MKDIESHIIEKLDRLKEKYEVLGQNWENYLEGLLHSNYTTYWEYINLDVLMSLQQPKTFFPDESIFIMYHQITELYFKLTKHALAQICREKTPSVYDVLKQVNRANSYFTQLINSFDIMVNGMDKEQFVEFRMALLPASGFQSAQYREIEVMCTDIINLVNYKVREDMKFADLENIYENLYWKTGATELATKKKTLTLKQFEEKYSTHFLSMINDYKKTNLNQVYLQLSDSDKENKELIHALRQLDFSVNVLWPLSHYRSAVKHLDRKPDELAATGGTNWQEYLPPKNQRVYFFPDLWTDEEFEEWGKKISFS